MSDVVELRDVRLVGDTDWIAAAEICRLCRLELSAVVELAELGLVFPRGHAPEEWQLPASALPRVAITARHVPERQ